MTVAKHLQCIQHADLEKESGELRIQVINKSTNLHDAPTFSGQISETIAYQMK